MYNAATPEQKSAYFLKVGSWRKGKLLTTNHGTRESPARRTIFTFRIHLARQLEVAGVAALRLWCSHHPDIRRCAFSIWTGQRVRRRAHLGHVRSPIREFQRKADPIRRWCGAKHGPYARSQTVPGMQWRKQGCGGGFWRNDMEKPLRCPMKDMAGPQAAFYFPQTPLKRWVAPSFICGTGIRQPYA